MSKPDRWALAARRLKLRDLSVFLTVTHCGSMAKAAAHLGITQPAVSQVISSLEQILGLKLFDRNAQGVLPTIYGRALEVGVTASTDTLAQTLRHISFLQDPTVGDFKIGCADTVSVLLVPIIERMIKQSPMVTAHILDTVAPTLHVPAVLDRKIDLAIVRIAGPLNTHRFHPELDVEVLFNDLTTIVAGKSSKWARRRKIDISELEGEKWILPPPETLNHQVVVDTLAAAGCAPPQICLLTFSFQLRAKLLSDGPYLSVLPLSVMEMCGDWLPVKVLPVSLRPHVWPTVVVTLKNRTPNPLAAIFIKQLKEGTKSLDVAIGS